MWQFWIDRGGTFTDVVARSPDGEIVVRKLLSDNRQQYKDAAIQGIREILQIPNDQPVPTELLDSVKMGTTVATNALLERRGARTALFVTRGFRDALVIGYQNRPDIFALEIKRPKMLYERVWEIDERLSATGEVLRGLDIAQAAMQLADARSQGIESCAIALMHAYRFPQHELELAEMAKELGYKQISISSRVSPLIKLISRGDTTLVDAYLSPVLRKYVEQVSEELPHDRLYFMQSNGGLTKADYFEGKDSILSGPAGGIVGAVRTCESAGFDKIITFDMGGTSTDVAQYSGNFDRTNEAVIAGARMRAPMLSIHTIAAGGGSVVYFDGERFRVGPKSAGANPGPASYRKGGPLTITDCNVMLGKIQAEFFPHVFGENGDEPLDVATVKNKFSMLSNQVKGLTGLALTSEQIAEGFISVAVQNMANAIKAVTLQRGHDVTEYTLCCFGGAGGQHACLIADVLGIQKVVINHYAGVLSALGMGMADAREVQHCSVETSLTAAQEEQFKTIVDKLQRTCALDLESQFKEDTHQVTFEPRAQIRYQGTDSALEVPFASAQEMKDSFEAAHRRRFGFITEDKELVVENLLVEGIATLTPPPLMPKHKQRSIIPIAQAHFFSGGEWNPAQVLDRDHLGENQTLKGPAIVIEPTGTNVIEPGWQAEIIGPNLILTKAGTAHTRSEVLNTDVADPIRLEIFNSLFMAAAEQMGFTLQNTSHSVNIKERLDFSCAIFDGDGSLVANAPHIPVHLGSMGESVKCVMESNRDTMQPGDVFVLNNPYHGGTHLPDITVITPVWNADADAVWAYVASRGHHADIGGITPGSMPPQSTSIDEEGVLIDNFKIVSAGHFLEDELVALLSAGPHPARNIRQNIADLRAQIAANEKGLRELNRLVEQFGSETVTNYMRHVQDNAEATVRRVIDNLTDGSATVAMDDGSEIRVSITIDKKARAATIDFTGTSSQRPNNFNAPLSVCKAAVLYVFRTLVQDAIPLNAGCMKPLHIIVPPNSMLNPTHPAAVVAGNVETSQAITDALYAALGIMAASQGTMNNFTFGNSEHQYYETICGGSGAGRSFHGCDAIHTNMTNSRLTDPEVLELRFPILLEEFSIRTGSGGAGRFHGGDGTTRRLRFLEAMTASILSTRRVIPPFGLEGGQSAKPGRNQIQRSAGELLDVGGTASVQMSPGETIIIETPGGGGFGD